MLTNCHDDISIFHFKNGDIITRTMPSKHGNRNLIGYRMSLIGIANGLIYVKIKNPFLDIIQSMPELEETIPDKIPLEKRIGLNLELFERGWAYYISPDKLEKEKPLTKDEALKKYYKAVKNEEYELADTLKKKFNL